MPQRNAIVLIALGGLLTMTSCAPGKAETPATPGEAPTQPPKTLTFAIQREPTSFDRVVTGAGTGATNGGAANPEPIVHDGLTRATYTGETAPLIATELPSDTAGTWVVNPDGSMDVTWRIVRNARWHDGTPVTSADFEFAFTVRSDPDSSRLPTGGGASRLTQAVTPIDSYTFVAHWGGITIDPDALTFTPLPKHLLETLYLQDKEGLSLSRFFTTEFVGTGPFKLTQWEPGSYIDFQRFDEYYKGPARLSRVIVRIVPDPNTMAANLLAEAVDLVPPPGVELGVALELRDRWLQDGAGHQVLLEKEDKLEQFELMLDPTYAKPANAVTQPAVRQALLQAIDRQTLMETMTHGLSEVAHSFYFPGDPNYAAVKDSFPVFPYDQRRAQDLLAGAGWARGADGVLVHQAGGQRFGYQVLVRQGSGPLKQATIIQDYWKAVGVALDVHVLTPAESDDNEFLSTRTGAAMTTNSGAAFYGRRLHSTTIPRPETRWTGNNRGRFSSPVVDDVLDRLAVTVNTEARLALHRQLIQEVSGQVIHHPFFWQVSPVLMLRGVTGPRLAGNYVTGNIWEWDKT